MAKLAQNFAKYVIHAKVQAKGIVERPDVIGAIFGQTEGLLGADLDLRELQHTGRIGRIEVNVKNSRGRSTAEVIIPSSLDASETSLIAASLETIDKVGPCDAEVQVVKVDDVRTQKRKYTINRAKEVLREMMDTSGIDSVKMSESIKEAVRAWEVSTYKGLSAGPDIENNDEIIIVEGRADVINLLKNGIRNVLAIEGSKIPKAVVDFTKEKVTTAFLDGDRGGELDLKKLLHIADIDYVARAEEGKEVEELTKKQIYKALREKVPVNQLHTKNKSKKTEEQAEEDPIIRIDDETKETFSSLLEDLVGTRAAYLINRNREIITKLPLSEISDMIDDFSNIYAIIFDGKINQSIVDMAKKRGITYVVGMDYREHVQGMNTLTLKELKSG